MSNHFNKALTDSVTLTNQAPVDPAMEQESVDPALVPQGNALPVFQGSQAIPHDGSPELVEIDDVPILQWPDGSYEIVDFGFFGGFPASEPD